MADDILRVHYEDDTFEDIEANGLNVCNDGSLILMKATLGQPAFVCWIRAGLVKRIDKPAPQLVPFAVIDGPASTTT
jgi:hypothetical protein